jgi:hypothetical protein
MSLINDALKRANEVNPQEPPPAEGAPPLRPAEHKPRPAWSLVVFPLLALVVFALAGWFLVKGYYAAQQLKSPQTTVSARESQPEESPRETVVTNARPPIVEQVVAAPVTNPPAVTAESSPPSMPAIKLQGIFYRPSRPSAMINSKTVFVGDRVGEVKILSISRETVTLEFEGQTKVLTLP